MPYLFNMHLSNSYFRCNKSYKTCPVKGTITISFLFEKELFFNLLHWKLKLHPVLRYYSEYLPVILQFSRVVESEDFLWFQLYPINCSSSKKSTTTPYFFKTTPDSSIFENPTPTILKIRHRQFWKPDSDNFENPTPAILKTRLQQFWKPDSDNFENPTPTILKTRLRQFWKPDSDNFENPTPTILKTKLRQFWKPNSDRYVSLLDSY